MSYRTLELISVEDLLFARWLKLHSVSIEARLVTQVEIDKYHIRLCGPTACWIRDTYYERNFMGKENSDGEVCYLVDWVPNLLRGAVLRKARARGRVAEGG